MTQGLARVEELFEARNPKVVAEISDIDGEVSIRHEDQTTIVTIKANKLEEEEYYFGEDFELAVKEGQAIKEKQIIARQRKEKQRVTANFSGEVKKAMP